MNTLSLHPQIVSTSFPPARSAATISMPAFDARAAFGWAGVLLGVALLLFTLSSGLAPVLPLLLLGLGAAHVVTARQRRLAAASVLRSTGRDD